MSLIKNNFWDQIEAQRIINNGDLTQDEKRKFLMEFLSKKIREEIKKFPLHN